MNYQTFSAHPDLNSLVKCYWILEVPFSENHERQRIIPDGCVEMAFILGDDVKRFTAEDEYILQPRAMVLGQTTDPFYIQPTGAVNTFAVRFYPFGFAAFVNTPLQNLANRETPISELFDEKSAQELTGKITIAKDTLERIELIESFLMTKLNEKATIDRIVKNTLDALLTTKGNSPVNSIIKGGMAERRKLERKFNQQIGISAKQMGKIIRLQTALKLLLSQQNKSLTHIAYESKYYDQAHFIKDFKEFTGVNPKKFLDDQQMVLSSLFYQEE